MIAASDHAEAKKPGTHPLPPFRAGIDLCEQSRVKAAVPSMN
jgi:hypothetical protein